MNCASIICQGTLSSDIPAFVGEGILTQDYPSGERGQAEHEQHRNNSPRRGRAHKCSQSPRNSRNMYKIVILPVSSYTCTSIPPPTHAPHPCMYASRTCTPPKPTQAPGAPINPALVTTTDAYNATNASVLQGFLPICILPISSSNRAALRSACIRDEAPQLPSLFTLEVSTLEFRQPGSAHPPLLRLHVFGSLHNSTLQVACKHAERGVPACARRRKIVAGESSAERKLKETTSYLTSTVTLQVPV